MSKSLGNVIDPITYVDQFGSDALRYYLMKELSLDNDMVFAHDLFTEVYNADLANIYGNLVSRTLGMIHQYCQGQIKYHEQANNTINQEFKQKSLELIQTARDCINSFAISELVKSILNYARSVNKAIENVAP
jgi:methionyl-tRNA synthetase